MEICVFGSSSLNLDTFYIEAVENVCCELGSRGHSLVFGGYEMGLMGAAARGFARGGGHVCGVITETLNGKNGRLVFPCDEVVTTDDLSSRKAFMLQRADAFLTMPGGIGTFDELFDVLAQAKAGESTKPCALYNLGGFYDPLIAMLDKACETGLNSSDWSTHCVVFDDVAQLPW